MSLSDLPQSKWLGAVNKEILISDLAKIEAAIIEAFALGPPPPLVYVDANTVKVQANANAPIKLMLNGYPNILNPGLFLSGGLADGKYRSVTTDASLDITVAGKRWGSQKSSQWYQVYAIAAAADTAFTLKAMPLLRFSSQAGQVITLRNNTNSADIGYGFTTDEFVGGMIYILSGTSKGLMRAITANNNNDTTGGTITYGGTALTMTQGDWFTVFPVAAAVKNFRWVGNFLIAAINVVQMFYQQGDWVTWLPGAVALTDVSNGVHESINIDPLASMMQCLATPTGLTEAAARVGPPGAAAAEAAMGGFDGVAIVPGSAVVNVDYCSARFLGWDTGSVIAYAYPAKLRG